MVRSPRETRVFHAVSLSLQLFRLMNRLVQNPLDPPPLRSICDLKLAAVIPKIGLLGVHYRTSRRFRRAVGGRNGQRHEAQPGGDVDDGGLCLILQEREECGGQTDRTEQVRGDDRLRVAETS